MDTDYCWAHLKKVFGVKVVPSQFGKGLAAARNIPVGSLVAPLGGVQVRKNQSWEGKKATPIYSYTLSIPDGVISFHRRPSTVVEGTGFKSDLHPENELASGMAGEVVAHHNWPRVQPTEHDRQLRVAAEVRVDLVRRPRFWRQYLVHASQYNTFQEEQVRRLAHRLGQPEVTPEFRQEHITDSTLSFSNRNEALWNYNQFEAYIEFRQHKEIQLDATCLRRVGSYANDPSTIVPVARGGGLKVADPARAEAEANVKIASNELFPLSASHTGWLVATRDIASGQPIQVFYGLGYWRTANAVKYDTKRVSVFPRRNPGAGRTLPVFVPVAQRGIQKRPRNETCKLK